MNSVVAPEGMVSVSEFSKIKNIAEDKIIDMIRDGFYVGKVIDEQWFVSLVEDSSHSNNVVSSSNPHKYQSDINKALSAISVGSGLSIFISIIHIIAFVALFAFSTLMDADGVFLIIFIGVGLLLSWAITYSLLSIVVTNALTAKHVIFQSTKI